MIEGHKYEYPEPAKERFAIMAGEMITAPLLPAFVISAPPSCCESKLTESSGISIGISRIWCAV